MESNDNHKPFGIKRIIKSLKNSFAGLATAYKNEQSMYIQLFAALILVGLSIFLKISRLEWLCIIFIMGLTAGMELFNTSIENVTDLITTERHPLAKAAKDTASAAEFVISLMSLAIALVIFMPKIMALF